VGDAHVRVGGLDEAAQIAEVLRNGFGVPTGEVTVGLAVGGDDPTAKLPEELRAGERARAVTGVERDRQVGVGDLLAVHRVEEPLDVRPAGTLDPAALARLAPASLVELLHEELLFDAL
jgi:hypothetical protein